MAKRTPPSFDPAPPAGDSDTSWVYRTGSRADDTPRSANYERALGIVRKRAAIGGAAALVPVPFADIALIAGTQIAMVRELAHVYGVPYQRTAGRAAIGIAAGTTAARELGRTVFRSALKAVPGIGTAAASVAMPAAASASIYALGRMFIKHFEDGGGLDDFDRDAAARHAEPAGDVA